MDIRNQVSKLIDAELSRVTAEDIHMVKSAGAIRDALAIGALGLGGLIGGKYLSDYANESELESMRKMHLQNQLAAAALGASAGWALKDPLKGVIAPSPDSSVSLKEEDFDSLWKNRAKRRF